MLTGILVSAAGEGLRMVATDSYRLSVKETRSNAAAEAFEANVPARALAGARPRIVRDERRAITIGVRANQVVFEVEGVVAVVAPDRWPVPELSAAAARGLRARADG